jgi:iron complex outermembrane receptor protein
MASPKLPGRILVRNLSNFSYLTRRLAAGAGSTAIAAMFAVVFALPTTALAQSGAAGALLEEIVTTARKRSEAEIAQEVPIAVSVFGAAQLEALFVKKLDDLTFLMPNVQLEAVGTFPGVQNFSIRGQGINSSIPSVDPTVGVFVDGIYMGTTYGVVIDTFDLESVEVLRGPQGLLFGRNVTGGAVVLRNQRPNGEFGARFRVGATDEEQVNIAGAIEGSLVEDKLAAKLVVYFDDDRGYFKNVNQTFTGPQVAIFPIAPAPYPGQTFYIDPATRSQVGALETTLVRPSFVWTPTDNTDVFLSVEIGKTEGDGAVWTNVTQQRDGDIANFSTSADEIGFTDIEWTQVVLEFNIAEVGNGTLTNILGTRDLEARSGADIDGIYFPLFTVPGITDQDQISNELRWSGSFTDNWDATLGLYYFEQDVEYRESRYIQIALLRALGGDMQAENFGVFWNNDFYLNDTWTLTAGIRYTDEKKTAQIITGGCADVVTFNCTFDNLSGNWSNVTPKIGAQWNYNDNSQLYGFWTQGFRSGGFNFRNAKPLIIPPGPTTEEENNTFEIGLKTDFANGKVRLNIAAFHNEIDDMQRELNIPDPDVVVLQGTINAGDVTIKGFELDFVALLTDTFSINFAYGWQDGEYTRIDPIVATLEPFFGTVIGPELPRLAPTNYNIGFSWDLPLGGSGLVNLAANHSYRERHPYNDSNTEFFEDQRRTNVSINWFSPSEAWGASLYGKNLGDEANWGNLTSISGIYTAGPMQKGRFWGIEVNYRMQ